MSLYSGTVVSRERVKDFLVLYTKENTRPLAILHGSQWVPNGTHISAEANPGKVWDFATSREISLDLQQSKPYELEKRIPGIAEQIAPLILDWLQWNRTCCSDDIYEKLRDLFPNRDPRIAGVGFAYLSRQGKIRKIGFQRSKRKECHYYPNMSIWELKLRTPEPLKSEMDA